MQLYEKLKQLHNLHCIQDSSTLYAPDQMDYYGFEAVSMDMQQLMPTDTRSYRTLCEETPVLSKRVEYGRFNIFPDNTMHYDLDLMSRPGNHYNTWKTLNQINKVSPWEFGYTLRVFHSGLTLKSKYENTLFFITPYSYMSHEGITNVLSVNTNAFPRRSRTLGFKDSYNEAMAMMNEFSKAEHAKLIALNLETYLKIFPESSVWRNSVSTCKDDMTMVYKNSLYYGFGNSQIYFWRWQKNGVAPKSKEELDTIFYHAKQQVHTKASRFFIANRLKESGKLVDIEAKDAHPACRPA